MVGRRFFGGGFKQGLLRGSCLLLVAFFPFAWRHAVDKFAGRILIHCDILIRSRLAIPVTQTVAAESGEIHEIDILHVGPGAQMSHQSSENGRFELFARALIHLLIPGWSQRSGKLYRGQTYLRQYVLDYILEASSKCARRVIICDEILPDLDQHMRQAAHRAVAIEAIIFEFSRIRLVVADDNPGFLEHADHRPRDAAIAIPKDSYLPGPASTFPKRREAVYRKDYRNDARSLHCADFRGNFGVIRGVKLFNPPLNFGIVDARVARNHIAIGQFHDKRGIVGTAIEVDKQTRPARQDGCRAECSRKCSRYLCRADVRGDMRLERLLRQA